MKINKLHITSVIIVALSLFLTNCGNSSSDQTTLADEQVNEPDIYENAQLFNGKNTKVDFYYLGTKRIAPDMIKVEFDLVNHDHINHSITMSEGDSFYQSRCYAAIDGKQMPIDEINVNGWSEKKREHQYIDHKKLFFITPDEWQPSMLPEQTYHCYITYKIPEDATYLNELGFSYGVMEGERFDSLLLKTIDIN